MAYNISNFDYKGKGTSGLFAGRTVWSYIDTSVSKADLINTTYWGFGQNPPPSLDAIPTVRDGDIAWIEGSDGKMLGYFETDEDPNSGRVMGVSRVCDITNFPIDWGM